MPDPLNATRRGNALLLATFILALVVAMLMGITTQLLGRNQVDVLSRNNYRAQDAAESIADALADRIKANATSLMTDLDTTQNSLTSWLTRGYQPDVGSVASAQCLWLNGCAVYWRLEPVASYDRTIVDSNGTRTIDDNDLVAAGATRYLINQSPDVIASAEVPNRPIGTAAVNPGLLFFELTVDAYAMINQDKMNANPLAVAGGIPTANQADRAPIHYQVKKRVLVKSASLFRYVIFYNASGASGDLELHQAPNISVIGAVHTNGAAYLGFNVGVGVFGSSPAVADANPYDSIPGLKPISFTAVNGIFCLRKQDDYLAGFLDPMAVPRINAVNETAAKQAGLHPTYLNSVQLSYASRTVGGFPLQLPSVTGSLQNPLSVARDSRQNAGGSPLSGYDPRLVRDGPNRQLRTIDITTRLKMSSYRPLEPFTLVSPGTRLLGSNGSYSVVAGTATTAYATDMMLFQTSSQTQDVLPTQNSFAGENPSPSLSALGLPTPNAALVSSFNATTPIPGLALVPPVIARTASTTLDPNDIFSNLANYIQPVPPNNSPVLNRYIRNPLGLNPIVTPGVGIVILERGKQAAITTWPSGRLGQVSWDPPSIYSRNDANTGLGPLYYDTNGNGTIDAGMISSYLMDYCQWLRSNYVVYFGVDGAGRLLDITDQFFSVPAGATLVTQLLAREDTFKDRREGRWRQSSANQYTAAGATNYDNLMVNTLTLNIGAVCNFIRTTPLNRLDPSTSSTSPALSRFNGAIYLARTPRYSSPGTPGTAGKGFKGVSSSDQALLLTYRQYGEFHPLAPLGFSPLQTGLNAQQQRTSLPTVAGDTIPTGTSLCYPVVGDAAQASLNGFGSLPRVVFGSSANVWSNYPLLKRVRIANASAIDWGGVRANGRNIGLTIYTPNACYLWGNFNVQADSTGNFPSCALYCDGITALSNNWTDVAANAMTGTGRPLYTNAASTVHRLCMVIHNTPTDLANINVPDVWQPGGSGGVHNVIKFLENWSGIDWAFIGSLVVLDRARYTRGYLGNQDVYEPPVRLYCFNDDLFRELPPFPDMINDVFIW